MSRLPVTDFDLIRGRLMIFVDLLDNGELAEPVLQLESIVSELGRLLVLESLSSPAAGEHRLTSAEHDQIRDAYDRLGLALRRDDVNAAVIRDALLDTLVNWPDQRNG